MQEAPRGMARAAIAGETAYLLPERALFLPEYRLLLVADPHFGKGGVFRRNGIPLPAGTTGDDLDRLSGLINGLRPEALVILGDFFHGPPVADEPWLDIFRRWRRKHAAVPVRVIAGNHDRAVGPACSALGLDWHLDGLELGPFFLAHEPTPVAGRHVLAGHLHPVTRLRGQGDRLRVPVFWTGAERTVLPSFGSLTGGYAVRPRRGERLFAVGPDAVVELSAGG